MSKFGLVLKVDICNVSQLVIKKINENIAQMFYSIFHYTNSIRKGATTFGAYYNDELIACISYTYPIRTQIAENLSVKLNQVMEISRLARHPNLKCTNLMSWFIGKTRKLLPLDVKIIVSYSDTGQGHSGGVYRSCGFTNDKIIEPDYYYISINGKYHKKTIWDKSKKFKMSEFEYAEKHNLQKAYGQAKSRWVFYL